MGRKSREKRERHDRESRRGCSDSTERAASDIPRTNRIRNLQDQLREEVDGDAVFWTSDRCPTEVQESDLEDILAFESTGKGVSLFLGLQERGIALPRPEELSEQQSIRKIEEVLHALARLRIFLIGYETMSPCEFYATLWNETLWEGCYVEKRNPGAMTLIDVSHQMSHADFMRLMEDMHKGASVQ